MEILNSDQYDLCDVIYKVYIYIERFLNMFGLLLNTLNIIAYLQLIKRIRCDMYKYLLFKSFADAFFSLNYLLYILYNNNLKIMQQFLVAVYIYWILIVYGGWIAWFMSTWCEFGACFSRFRKVSKIFSRATLIRIGSSSSENPVRRLSKVKLVVILMLLFSLTVNSYHLFERKIITKQTTTNSTTTTMYILIYNSFGFSNTVALLNSINSFLMNCLLILVILIMNIITLIKTLKRLRHKRALTTNASSTTSSSRPNLPNDCAAQDLVVRSRKKISKAEINISLMVFTSGLIEVLGNGFVFLYRQPFTINSRSFCFYSASNFTFSLSYVMSFFIYFLFDKNFRECCFSTYSATLGRFCIHCRILSSTMKKLQNRRSQIGHV